MNTKESPGSYEEKILWNIFYTQNDVNLSVFSSAVIFCVLCLCNFIAPSIVAVLKEKWSMAFGSLFYVLFFASFFYITNALLFTCSVLVGFGAAVIWVSQGSYLSKNSDDLTASRNSGIFWLLYQSSLLFGGLIAYFVFVDSNDNDNANLSNTEITEVYVSFTVTATIGVFIFLFLKQPKTGEIQGNGSGCFESVYYPTARARTRARGARVRARAKARARAIVARARAIGARARARAIGARARARAAIGKIGPRAGEMDPEPVGEVHWTTFQVSTAAERNSYPQLPVFVIFVAAGIFSFFGKQLNRFGRNKFVFFALFVGLTTYILTFINIPSNAPLTETYDTAYIAPNQYLALLCSILFGFTDAVWNVQVGGTSISYFYIGSGHLLLQYDLLILAIFACLGTIGFINAEWMHQENAKNYVKC